jgi:glycosyltransferase involved in cell wall biosynthesis
VRPSWGERVDENDLPSVANAIRKLLRDPHRRRGMGIAAREHVLANYTWGRIAKQYLDIFSGDVRAAGTA